MSSRTGFPNSLRIHCPDAVTAHTLLEDSVTGAPLPVDYIVTRVEITLVPGELAYADVWGELRQDPDGPVRQAATVFGPRRVQAHLGHHVSPQRRRRWWQFWK